MLVCLLLRRERSGWCGKSGGKVRRGSSKADDGEERQPPGRARPSAGAAETPRAVRLVPRSPRKERTGAQVSLVLDPAQSIRCWSQEPSPPLADSVLSLFGGWPLRGSQDARGPATRAGVDPTLQWAGSQATSSAGDSLSHGQSVTTDKQVKLNLPVQRPVQLGRRGWVLVCEWGRRMFARTLTCLSGLLGMNPTGKC